MHQDFDFKPPYPCVWFPVPKQGSDPFFGRSRAWWYLRQQVGDIAFRKLKFTGQKVGTRPHINFSDAVKMFRKAETKGTA